MDDSKCADIVPFSQVDIKQKNKDFGELLVSIENCDDKQRALLLEVYENSIIDRQNAYALLETLITICGAKTSEHAIHSRTIVAVIERMGKSNDQLLKLAVFLNEIKGVSSDPTTPDELYGAMTSDKKKR